MAQRGRPESKAPDEDFNQWFNKIYDLSKFSEEDFQNLYEMYKYKGFDRTEVLKSLKLKVQDVDLIHHIIVVCALNGPVKASQTKLKNGKTLQEMGIPASARGEKVVSCGRITAATADLAAFMLKKFNIPKRINTELPAWLQFPSAASIKMPENYRILHRQFAIDFSKQINGEHNDGIYDTMVRNAYLDERLKLF